MDDNGDNPTYVLLSINIILMLSMLDTFSSIQGCSLCTLGQKSKFIQKMTGNHHFENINYGDFWKLKKHKEW